MNRLKRQLNAIVIIAIAAFLLLTGSNAVAQKQEHISATAMGTSTQLGRIVNVDFRIFGKSSGEEQQALLQAFKDSGSQGLANAVEKMRAKGRIAITGTLGYDVNYIREFKMKDGSRRIRFVTDRPIRFGEAWSSSRSMDYELCLGEIIISAKKGGSSGTLMPAAMLKLTKKGEIEIETYQNPWKLQNIRIW